MRSGLEEIPRSNLEPFRFGTLEDTTTGTFYQPRRDGLIDFNYVKNAIAFYVDRAGLPVLLERSNGPQTRAELEAREDEREQRRNAPKPRPAWMNSVSVRRDKAWYLVHDPTGEVAALDIKLDCIDIEIDGLLRIQHEETKARLQRLGFDVSNYRPPPPRLRSEQRCFNHIRADDDIEAIVVAATERLLDRAYREHIAARENVRLRPGDKLIYGGGQPIRRTFEAKFTIR